MDLAELLTDHFDRIRQLYGDLARDLDEDALAHRPEGTGNSIGWLLWHVARLQDDHVAHLAGTPQKWRDWQERLGLANGEEDMGYGHTSEQVDAIRIAEPLLLIAYHADVHEMTTAYLAGVDAAELDRVVDTRWDPPVTAGVRLVSLIGDCLQHLGQVGYVRGLLGR
ncbi:mycothiol transferase [Nocardioides sp. GXQ0305]|uniref:mycothiol transferase n=1 Tax=Nocardioides sp. GXQ0305 TaxID=3423912 RepID=UPI003D7CC244